MASIKQYRGKTWRVIVRRKGHPAKSKTFESKRDAQAWAVQTEARMGVSRFDAQQLHAAKTYTVKDLFQRYADEVACLMRGRNEKGTVKRLIRDAPFMQILLTRVTPDDIRNWRDHRSKQIQPQSVNREFNTISGVFNHAIKEWRAPLDSNPCHLVMRFAGVDKRRDQRWRPEDVDVFLETCKWRADVLPKKGRDYVGWALLIAIETSMREGELCMPLVSDFHPEESYVYLRQTKNGEARLAPLSPNAVEYFKHLCKGRRHDEKIFPLVANTLSEYVLDVRRACGLEKLVFHDTRHEAITRMAGKLSNVLELSAVSGHKNLSSLRRYFNPTPAEIAAKLA